MFTRRLSSILNAAAPSTAGAALSADSALPISRRVHALQRSAAYLRHAPPTLYITKDLADSHEEGEGPLMRHCTRVLDSAGTYDSTKEGDVGSTPRSLQTHCVFLLSSTSEEDMRFEKDGSISSVLVGLPRVRSAAEAADFLSAHANHLRHVRAVLLPEIAHSGAGHAVRALATAHPDLAFVGSKFSQAFLTDPTFFDGVRRTVLANELVRPEEVAFAELPASAFQPVGDGEGVAVACAGGRRLTAHYLREERREERVRRTRRTQPAHFHNQPIFYHDSAFDALFVGAALCHLPWLPQVITEAGRGVVLPAPPMLAAQHAGEGAVHPLLATWRPTEAAEAFAKTIQEVPMVLHLMTETYGEPVATSGPEGAAVAATDAADQLEALRSRLSARLETDTARDVTKWRRLLLPKVMSEVVSVNRASQPTDRATQAAFAEWALEAGNPLGALVSALTQAAVALPPTTRAAVQSASTQRGAAKDTQGQRQQSPASELEGASGVTLMGELLAKKGLGGLAGVARKEEIDVAVFLAMSPDDFRRVFKATFGVSKKLEMLQSELREKL